jgi:hypothetical protein
VLPDRGGRRVVAENPGRNSAPSPLTVRAMKTQLRKLSTISPYPGNPRSNDEAVPAVAASIREFGFRQPIVVDEAGVIIVGHTRYKAALFLGLDKVPVHVALGSSSPRDTEFEVVRPRVRDYVSLCPSGRT